MSSSSRRSKAAVPSVPAGLEIAMLLVRRGPKIRARAGSTGQTIAFSHGLLWDTSLFAPQIAALRSEMSSGESEFARLTRQRSERQQRLALDREEMGKIRGVTSANEVVNS